MRDIIINLQDNSKEVLQYSKDMAVATDETVQSIEAVSVTIEELANGATNQVQDAQSGARELTNLAQEISASMEEQTSAMEEISNTAENLEKIVSKLNEIVQRFIL